MTKKLTFLLFSVCIIMMVPGLANAQVIHEVKYGDSLDLFAVDIWRR
ncbi:hypothetical protein V7111_11245 [Neobacillus niacini]